MAGGSVTYAEGTDLELPPLETDRRVLLDRWNTHVKDCPSCSGAHRNLRIAKVIVNWHSLLNMTLAMAMTMAMMVVGVVERYGGVGGVGDDDDGEEEEEEQCRWIPAA